MRSVCCNAVPAGLQVCPCRHAVMMLSVHLLMHIYQGVRIELALERRRFGYRRIWQLLRTDTPSLTWSMDFVMDALANGRRIKCLTCVDDFTKECLTITIAFGISGVQVTRILDSIALFRGYPDTIKPIRGLSSPSAHWTNGPLSMAWNCILSSQTSRLRTHLLRVLTDD